MTNPNDFQFAASEFSDGIDADTGKPGIAYVANAIQFWSIQHYDAKAHRCPSVRETAHAFNLPDWAVRQAVQWHPFMFCDGPQDDPTKQFIEHDGE